MCRDDHGRIQYSTGKLISDYPILLVGTLAIHEAVMASIQANFLNVIIESAP